MCLEHSPCKLLNEQRALHTACACACAGSGTACGLVMAALADTRAKYMLPHTVCQLPTLQGQVALIAAACCNTVPQVNAALEEVVAHAAVCYKQMVLVSRNQLNSVAAEERQRWHDLYHGVEVSTLAPWRTAGQPAYLSRRSHVLLGQQTHVRVRRRACATTCTRACHVRSPGAVATQIGRLAATKRVSVVLCCAVPAEQGVCQGSFLVC